ncbi:hypothetical protein FRC03_008451 [Tulasnella sp. 419]|nr:hypothetical protein FRC03_008451 [Tulasnella sp. 419]
MWSIISKTLLVSLTVSTFTTTTAAPVWSSRNIRRQPAKRQTGFQFLDYPDFQISGGTAGNAKAEADAIFVDPFSGVDLATVDEETLIQVCHNFTSSDQYPSIRFFRSKPCESLLRMPRQSSSIPRLRLRPVMKLMLFNAAKSRIRC